MAEGRLLKTPEFTESDMVRFWSNVKKTPMCWNWMGPKNKFGYARFYIQGKQYRVHRLSYFLHTGKEPGKMCVLHRCDNRSCINPRHLWLGTDADNTRDRDAKGRNNQPSGDRNGSRLHPERLRRGENHPNCKLSEFLVREIRDKYSRGDCTQPALAQEYCVAQSLIGAIIHRKIWKHVK